MNERGDNEQSEIGESNPVMPCSQSRWLTVSPISADRQSGHRDSNPDISVPETDDSCQLVYVPISSHARIRTGTASLLRRTTLPIGLRGHHNQSRTTGVEPGLRRL